MKMNGKRTIISVANPKGQVAAADLYVDKKIKYTMKTSATQFDRSISALF